jgi:membrane-associated protease RseP (regulator of RpoE activity)
MQPRGQNGQTAVTANGQPGAPQRGELGVWLMAGAGPGVEIRQITAGSAAEQIGLRPGDLIVQINGQAVASPLEVQQIIRAIPAGQTATLAVLRDGAQQEVSVTLQPMRERYRSGYRGGEFSPASGGLESRTMRLEEQLAMVMRELEQIREHMARLHPESSGQPAGAAVGAQQSAGQPQPSPFDSIEAQQPAPAEPAASQPEPAASEPASPEPAATEPPAAEPAESSTEPAEDLFGTEPAEPQAAPAGQTDAEKKTENEEKTESDSDSLFE